MINQDLEDVADWMNCSVDELNINIKQEPISKFMRQIKEMYSTYDEFPQDAERTGIISSLIKQGEDPFPIYVEANDPYNFVMEGRHRMVAFWQLGMESIPVAYVSKKELSEGIISEARRDSVILVDFQPAHYTEEFGYIEAMEAAINYINEKQPSVTVFFNGEDVAEDRAGDVAQHYVDMGLDEDLVYDIDFKEKTYGWFRSWMSYGVSEATITKVARYMVMNNFNDSREIEEEIFLELVGDDFDDNMYNDALYLPEISIADLKSLSGSLLGGGGRHECLQEIQMLMNAFNIKYKLVNGWIYG